MPASTTIAEMLVKIGTDTDDLDKGLKAVSSQIKRFGRDLKEVGGALTRSVTLPLVGLAGIAFKFAKDAGHLDSEMVALKSSFNNAGRALGDALLPALKGVLGFVTKLADMVAGLLEWFSKWPEPLQAVVIALAGIAALAGPILIFLGSVAAAISALIPLTAMLATNVSIATLGLAAVVGVAAVAAAGIYAYSRRTDEAAKTTMRLVDANSALNQVVRDVDKIIMEHGQSIDALIAKDFVLNSTIGDLKDKMDALREVSLFKMEFIQDDELETLSMVEEKIGLTETALSSLSTLLSKGLFKEPPDMLLTEIENLRDRLDELRAKAQTLSDSGAISKIMSDLSMAKSAAMAQEPLIGRMEMIRQLMEAHKIAALNLTIANGGVNQTVRDQVVAYDELKLKMFELSTVQEVLNTLKETAMQTFDAFGQAMADTIIWGKSFTESIGAMFKQMAADVIKAIVSMIAKLIALRIIGTLFGMPAIGGGMMGPLGGLFGMAEGGIVTGPTLAMVGEAGPEAVIPLDKLGSMGGNQTIVVELDGRTLAAQTVQHMPSVIRMKTGMRAI